MKTDADIDAKSSAGSRTVATPECSDGCQNRKRTSSLTLGAGSTMGIDYVYANHTKKQYLDVGLFGESCRGEHAGYSFGSRALSLLVSEQGSWNCDSIEMVGDVGDKSLKISAEYTNIGVEAELLILDVDGVAVFDAQDELDFSTFTKLCLCAMILRRPDVLEFLDGKYGPGGWQRQYKDHYRGVSSGLEDAIHEAQGRGLKLYHK
jgi:hypothetical protein